MRGFLECVLWMEYYSWSGTTLEFLFLCLKPELDPMDLYLFLSRESRSLEVSRRDNNSESILLSPSRVDSFDLTFDFGDLRVPLKAPWARARVSSNAPESVSHGSKLLSNLGFSHWESFGGNPHPCLP